MGFIFKHEQFINFSGKLCRVISSRALNTTPVGINLAKLPKVHSNSIGINFAQCSRQLHSSFTARSSDKTDKIKINIQTDDDSVTLEGEVGDSILDVIVNNDYEIIGYGACEGTIACSTCHCILKEKDYVFHSSDKTEEEKDLLDMISHIQEKTVTVVTESCLSLAGCGFIAPYLLGSVSAICEMQSKKSLNFVKGQLANSQSVVEYLLANNSNTLCNQFKYFSGASAGALLATILLSKSPDLFRLWQLFLNISADCSQYALGPFNRAIKMEEYIRSVLDELPDNVHEVVSDRLFISLTSLKNGKNVQVSRWNSKEDLISCLVCSCYIPMFSGGAPPSFRGQKYVDGGFTDNQPKPLIKGEPIASITVSPFSGSAMISPAGGITEKKPLEMTLANETVYLTAENVKRFYDALMPPPADEMERYFIHGFKDTIKYCIK